MSLLIGMLAIFATSDPPSGHRIELEGLGATLFVPEGYKANPGGSIDLILHLHGASSTIEPALIDSGFNAVLIEFNRKGLSKVYAEPFADPDLFKGLLDAARASLKARKLVDNPTLGRVTVSSFSAGFGGVRALLKEPDAFARIDGLIMADSIYCGYTGDPAGRTLDPALMDGFRRFAAEAAAGRKTFLLTHSAQVPEGYASTTETADFLIRSLGAGTISPLRNWGRELTQTRSYTRGNFVVLGFSGQGPEDHMAHLRRIGAFWRRYKEISQGTVR